MSVNKVILIGRVGRQPEVTTLNNGTRMAKFSLATNENYTDKQGQKVEQTEWHNCTIWGPQAEIVEKWITSGMLLYVEGKLKTSCYEKAGAKHYSTDVIVSNFRMLDRNKGKFSISDAADIQVKWEKDWTDYFEEKKKELETKE